MTSIASFKKGDRVLVSVPNKSARLGVVVATPLAKSTYVKVQLDGHKPSSACYYSKGFVERVDVGP